MSSQQCFICESDQFVQSSGHYTKCSSCGHELLMSGDKQTLMLNDPLNVSHLLKFGFLDRFKRKVLERCDPKPPDNAVWLDIGSSNGKYIYHNEYRYSRAVGLEVTPEAIKFSTEKLGLEIIDDINFLCGPVHVVTAWHSLEHFPTESLRRALATLQKRLKVGGRFIISVPNADSFQHRWLRMSYAFFDVPNHIHQFTALSLERLLFDHGFTKTSYITSWPYNIFGYIQGVLNRITGTHHNYLYFRLKRRSLKGSFRQDMMNALMLPIATMFGFFMGCLDAAWPKKQGVLTVCFEKTH